MAFHPWASKDRHTTDHTTYSTDATQTWTAGSNTGPIHPKLALVPMTQIGPKSVPRKTRVFYRIFPVLHKSYIFAQAGPTSFSIFCDDETSVAAEQLKPGKPKLWHQGNKENSFRSQGENKEVTLKSLGGDKENSYRSSRDAKPLVHEGRLAIRRPPPMQVHFAPWEIVLLLNPFVLLYKLSPFRNDLFPSPPMTLSPPWTLKTTHLLPW